MLTKVPAFIDKWGQTIIFAFLVLMMLSKLDASSTNIKLSNSVLRTDENLANLWSAVRQGNLNNLPPSPPVKPGE